ncbi:MAG TPA: S8 family serine peptidase [Actinomycetota bacterium]|nr:S8 family serine peptidase [Actinomycetota bacterium]
MRKLVSMLAAAVLVAAFAGPAAGASNDPHFAKQWGLQKIQAEPAWAHSDGTGAVIAVVDSGVDLDHPDLAAKIIDNPDADFVEPDGICTRDAKTGERVCVQDGPQDANGHGTHVAGIAAAITGNGVGVAGTAPGARILPVRVLDAEGNGPTESVADGIRYAADHNADVINLSLGYPAGVGDAIKLIGDLDPVYDAIAYAIGRGSVIVISAGNDTAPLCAQPAAAPEVLCVGATDPRDLRSYYSNGDATLQLKYLVAPGGAGLSCGEEIFSTYLRDADPLCSTESGYEGISGTSMAAPFVSGVAALLAGKGMTAHEITDCILRTTDDLGTPGRDPIYGYGRLNALNAVTICAAAGA